jgi:sugar (pentulose or hexulose) kinase
MKVIAVFDIGKTNKKFFLFDENLREVYREYAAFELIEDEDGHPTEDLSTLTTWVKETFDKAFTDSRFDIKSLNFSTYGASFVHIGKDGEPLTPLYNYTKLLPSEVSDEFYEKYGPEPTFTKTTGSTNSGMLNSGMQLYWLKKTKSEIFSKISYSLHLPQYLSYLFTDIPTSEFTSIGCHTSLWDFTINDYHAWVYAEEIDKLFPPISKTTKSVEINYRGKEIAVGIGIHDSSAALLTYVKKSSEPFVLLSTGTWNVSLNPFSKNPLLRSETADETILYMQVNGSAVKSNRVFLGNEFNYQVERLSTHYGVSRDYYKTIKFDTDIYETILNNSERHFRWESIPDEKPIEKTIYSHQSFEEAYHQLLHELIHFQTKNLRNAIGSDSIKHLYVDGGFAGNEIFIKLLKQRFPELKLYVAETSLGSALGAALCVSTKNTAKINS